MAQFDFTDDQLAIGRIVDPDWYPVEVSDVEDAPSKTDGSMNTNLTMRILNGKFKGTLLYRNFNEKPKARGFIADFFRKAIGIEPTTGQVYNMDESLIGTQFYVLVEHNEYKGRIQNNVVDFRKID